MNPLVKPTVRQLFDKQLRGVPLPGEVVDVAPEDEMSYIGRVGQAGMTGLDVADKILDTPQDITYNAILNSAGRQTDPTRIGDGNDELEGREVLREMGILRKGAADTYANYGAGLLMDLIVDPWNLVPIGPLTKVGKAAAKAGIQGTKAGRMATKAAAAGLDVAPTLTNRATQAAARAGKNVSQLTDAQIAGRPFARPRFANRNTTGQNLMDYLANPEMAQFGDELGAFANRAADLTPAQLAEPLRRDLGIQLPFMDPLVTFNVPGGGVLGDLIDSSVSALKFGKVGQKFRSAFDADVMGAIDLDDQVYATGQSIIGEEARKRGFAEGMTEAARIRGSTSGDDIFSEEGNRSLGRLLEQPVSYTKDAMAKDAAASSDPAVKRYVDWWSQKRGDMLDASRRVGVRADVLDDGNLGGYMPRSAKDLFSQYAEFNAPDAVNAQKMVQTLTGDQLARANSLKLPGGRDFIAFELAKDKRLVGPSRLAKTDEEAARIIGEKIEEQLAGSVDEAAARVAAGTTSEKDKLEIARMLHRLPDESVGGSPLFGQHPTEQIAKYMGDRTKSIAQGEQELQMIANNATNVREGPMVSVREAVEKVGLKQGKDNNIQYETLDTLKDMISRRTGEEANLMEWYLPQSTYDTLTRVKSLQNKSPDLGSAMRNFMSVWRNAILNWPSRYFRDFTGGYMTNLLVIPMKYWTRLTSLYPYAWQMSTGGKPPASLSRIVAKMPHYSGLDTEEAVAKFYGDLLAENLLQSTKKVDAVNAGAAIDQALPGYGDSVGQSLLDSFQYQGIFDSKSKFASGGARLGDFSDSVTRIAGYTELMLEGYTPEQASNLLKRAHVDYDSLSDFEKQIRNNIAPFYTFTSRSMLDTAERVVEQPGKVMNAMRLAGAPAENSDLDDTFIPRFARERTVFGATPTENGMNVSYNLDSPLLSALRMGGNMAQGDTSEISSMMSPVLKTVMENATGIDSFTKRPLAEKRGNLARAIGVSRNSAYHTPTQYLDRALELSPFVRPLGVAKDLSENKDDLNWPQRIGQVATNFGTGFKLRNISKEDLLYDAKRTAEEQLGGNLRTFETKYIPKDVVPMLDSRTQQSYTNMKQMEKIRKNISKRKAEDRQPRGMFNPLQD